MKLCMIGNSHLGAFKLGWDKIRADYPDVAPEFFGLARHTFRHTELVDGAIHPTKPELVEKLQMISGGQDRVPLADFDAFIVVGFTRGVTKILRYITDHGIAGEMNDRSQLISFEMLQEAWTEYMESTPGPHVLRLIRQVSDAPVVIHKRAMLSAGMLDKESTRGEFYKSMAASGDAPYAADLLNRLMAPHLDDNMIAISQPEETVWRGVLTKKKYSVYSKPLLESYNAHAEDDVTHMNAHYGATCMAQALETLGVMPQARSTITEPTE